MCDKKRALDLQAIRREYLRGGLDRSDLREDPVEQFLEWMQQALDMGLSDATAMSVATVSPEGQPVQRIVLLKHVDEKGFVFFTNYESRKARDLDLNNRVSLHFPWHSIERQVQVSGIAEKTSREESASYFSSRPLESQLAAWASSQSRPLPSRQALLDQFEAVRARFGEGEIPAPEFWGGYRVRPRQIEFWQGGGRRLHDRFQYSLQESGAWRIQRLAP